MSSRNADLLRQGSQPRRAPSRRWGIRAQILTLAVVPLSFLILLLVISGVIQKMTEQTEATSRTATAILAQAVKVQQTIGLATGALGTYYKTRKTSALVPYSEMPRMLPSEVAELRRLGASEAGGSPAVEKYIASTKTITDLTDGLAATLKAQRFDKVRAIVAAPATVKAGDDWRAAFLALQQEQELRALGGFIKLRAILKLLGLWALVLSAIGVGLTLIVAVRLIRHVSRPMNDAVVALTSGTSALLAGTLQQTSGVEEQAAAVSQTTSTVEEITQTAAQAQDRAKMVALSARRAADDGNAGRQAVEAAIVAMEEASAQSKRIAQRIVLLADKAHAIGEMNAIVTEIADQTNVLSLNAAIQAAQAKEHGSGFAIIAAEIKALAEQSKEATARVRQILGEIESAAAVAVNSTEEGTRSVEQANRAIQEAGQIIRLLSDTFAEASDAALQISASASQQAIGMSQIQQAMRSIAQATSTNLASTQEAERVARELDQVSVRLRALLRGVAAQPAK